MEQDISRGIPEHAVIAPCGHVFERDVIEEHLRKSQTCPIDGQPLTLEMLSTITVQRPNEYPALLRATSFDSILASLRQQWDSLQEENHDLRVKLATAQRELAEALCALRDSD